MSDERGFTVFSLFSDLPTKVRKVSDPSKLPPVVSGAPFSRPRAAVFSENAPLPTTSKKARVNDKTSSSNFNFENILDAMKETKNDSSRFVRMLTVDIVKGSIVQFILLSV